MTSLTNQAKARHTNGYGVFALRTRAVVASLSTLQDLIFSAFLKTSLLLLWILAMDMSKRAGLMPMSPRHHAFSLLMSHY